MRSFLEAIRPLIPFTSLFVLTTVWVLLSRNDICSREPRMMFVLYGTIFSNICVRTARASCVILDPLTSGGMYFQCRLIVAQMSDTRTDCWNAFIWPLMVVVLVSVIPYPQLGLAELQPMTEKWMVYVSTALATIAHIHYGQGVVSGHLHRRR